MTWTFAHCDDAYRDYAYYLKDAGVWGGQLMLSFDLERRTAFMSLRLDDRDATEYHDGGILNTVDLTWALGVAKAVDGWEFPTETPE